MAGARGPPLRQPFETVATFHDKKNNNVTVNIALQPIKNVFKTAKNKNSETILKNPVEPQRIAGVPEISRPPPQPVHLRVDKATITGRVYFPRIRVPEN